MITRLWFYYSIYDYIHRRACKLHSLETPTRMKIQRKLHSYSAQARLTCTRALTRAHTCTDTCIHTRTRAHAQATWRPWWLPAKALPKTTITHTFTLTHTHTCSHTHIHTHAQTHTQAHTHTHKHLHTHRPHGVHGGHQQRLSQTLTCQQQGPHNSQGGDKFRRWSLADGDHWLWWLRDNSCVLCLNRNVLCV